MPRVSAREDRDRSSKAKPSANRQAWDSNRWGLRSRLCSLLGQAGTCSQWSEDVACLRFAGTELTPGREDEALCYPLSLWGYRGRWHPAGLAGE